MNQSLKKLLSVVTGVSLCLAALAAPPALAPRHKALKGTKARVEKTAPEKRGFNMPKRVTNNLLSPASAKIAKARPFIQSVQFDGKTPLGADVPEIFGSVLWSTSWTDSGQYGLYELPKSATDSFKLKYLDQDSNGGGILVDGIYYCHRYLGVFGLYLAFIDIFDFETGEQLASIPTDMSYMAPNGLTYDPVTGNTYGIFYTIDNEYGIPDGYMFATIDYDIENAEATLHEIKRLSDPMTGYNSLSADADGTLYGIANEYTDFDGEQYVTNSYLFTIDKTTGAKTKIGNTGQMPEYMSDAVIDFKTGRMFWSLTPLDEKSYLCEVDKTTGEATLLYRLPGDEEVTGMFIPGAPAEDKAPAAPYNLSVAFPEGNLQGKVTFTAPTTLYDGTEASGKVGYIVAANDIVIKEGFTAYGTTLTVDVTLPAPGKTVLKVMLNNEVGNSPAVKERFMAGVGTPKAPKSVKASFVGNTMSITWTAVTESVDGSYINPAAVTYSVSTGETVLAEGLTATEYSFDIQAPDEFTPYIYEVRASFGGNTSEPKASNTVLLGRIVPEYTCSFDENDFNREFIVYDENGDGITWQYDPHDAAICEYNHLDKSQPMDDYMVFGPFALTKGFVYDVSVTAFAEYLQERFEVLAGTAPTPESLDISVIEPTEIEKMYVFDNSQTFSGKLVPDITGDYYIGIHAMSDADTYALLVSNFKVGEGVNIAAPGAPTLVAAADNHGAKRVEIGLIAPTEDYAGGELEGTLASIKLFCGDDLLKEWENVAPGTQLSFIHTGMEDGPITYTAYCENVNGLGETATTTCFVGHSKPKAPTGVNVTDGEFYGEALVTWTPPTTDINGVILNPADLTYDVWTVDENTSPWVVGEGVTGNSFTENTHRGEEQFFSMYAVQTISSKGNSELAYSPQIILGKPYEGFSESFANGDFYCLLGQINYNGEASWNIFTDNTYADMESQDGDNGYLALFTESYKAHAGLYTGKISLEGIYNPVLTFYSYTIVDEVGASDNEVEIEVREYGAKYKTMLKTTVDELGATEGWHKVSVPLTEFAGKTIQVRLNVLCTSFSYTFFDNFAITSGVHNDLSVKGLQAPAQAKPGDEFEINVILANEGTDHAQSHTVTLYADDEPVASRTFSSLSAGSTAPVTFTTSLHALAEDHVAFHATVDHQGDEVAENNSCEKVHVMPIVSTYPTVSDLEGASANNDVVLSWTAPDLDTFVPDTFEDLETATSYATELSGWTMADRDDYPTFGLVDVDLPGINPGFTKFAFMIMDDTNPNIPKNLQPFLAAKSGHKYLAALCREDDGQQDDWAISPELSGEAQTITFFARSYTSAYPERLSVLWSDGSLNPEKFQATEIAGVNPSETWTKYEVALPEGAKHFAFRSHAKGGYMLAIDDITFKPAGASALTLEGFNVYRGKELLNTEVVKNGSFTDANAPTGTHTYAVTSVYDRGTSAGSNRAVVNHYNAGVGAVNATEVTITADSRSITVSNCNGMAVTITAADGKVIYSTAAAANHCRVALQNGVYVVKAGQTVKSVLVK